MRCDQASPCAMHDGTGVALIYVDNWAATGGKAGPYSSGLSPLSAAGISCEWIAPTVPIAETLREMNRMKMREFPKTAMNRKASDVYEAASTGPVSLSEHGTSRFVIMSRRYFDEHFGMSTAPDQPPVPESPQPPAPPAAPAKPAIEQVRIENMDLDDEEAQPLVEELERLMGARDWG